MGSIPGLENKSPPCCWATKPVHHNYWACALQQKPITAKKPANKTNKQKNQTKQTKNSIILASASQVAQMVKNLPAIQET